MVIVTSCSILNLSASFLKSFSNSIIYFICDSSSWVNIKGLLLDLPKARQIGSWFWCILINMVRIDHHHSSLICLPPGFFWLCCALPYCPHSAAAPFEFFLKGAHWGFNCLYCIFLRWFQICDQNLIFFGMFFFIAIYIFFKYMILRQCASLYDNWDNLIISHQCISSYDNWDNFIYKFVVILDDLE